MASAMDAYNLLQQAAKASGAEQQALINQAKATLQESAELPETTNTASAATIIPETTNDAQNNLPSNSGTTADTQGENQTATASSGLQVQDEYAQYVGQKEGRVVDGIAIPEWVDDDYLSSYVSSAKAGNPRKPNNREMTEMIAGVPIEQLYGTMDSSEWTKYTSQSSQLLYGVVGSNEDTRDWQAITNAATDPTTGQIDAKEFVAATQIATSKMYGGTTVSYQSGGYRTNELGNTVLDANGEPEKLPPALYIMGGNGTVLTSLGTNANQMSTMMQNFGIRDASWIQNVAQAMAPDVLSTYQPAFDSIQNTYNPWANYQDLWDMNGLITGISPFQDPFKIVSGQTQATTTDTEKSQNLGVTEQTITPEGTTTDTQTVTQPTYDSTPQASEAVPVDQQQTMGTGVTGTGVYPQTSATTGTFSSPVQTGGIGAVPSTVQTYPNYTGTSMANLTSQSQQGFGGQRTYGNQFGQRITVTVDGSGKPITYVPPGYTPVQGQAEGGSVSEDGPDVQLARRFLGFTGPASQLTNFLAANPAAAARMGKYQQAMSGMAQNKVGAQEGIVGTSLEDFQNMQGNLISQTMQPIQSGVQQIQPQEADFIGLTAGQATPVSPMSQVATVGNVEQAQMPMMTDTATMTPASVFEGVQGVTAANTAQTGTVSDEAQVTAAQQGTSAVSDLKAAQGTAIMMDNPVQREIQDGELISGVANAEKAAEFTEQIEAATASPSSKATVAGQLEGLMAQFEGGNTPAWAAGSMRTAMQTLAARGLGASSLAGQAVIQAAMEAALPIAQMDAQTQAQFESQNLSNRQQRAMLAAQQRAQFLGQEFDQTFQARVQNSARIGDIANMNFTAEQNIALENSRAANTMNLNNLSNRQAMVMAEAAALSQLDMANLNNRQQAAVQNAQNFLQMDLTNLNNQQQSALFNAQQNIQALFTDQAAENAAAQFNATSENQTNQFFANLSAQTSQFNASQRNAMDQFNVNTTNAMRQFNSQIQQQRDLFNAQNGLVVAQANAQWRQNIATLNQAAQNESNMNLAKTINALTSTNLDQIWQRERDIMSFAFTSQQSALDRSLKLLLGDKKIEEVEKQLSAQQDAASTDLAFRFLFGSDPSGIFGGIFNKK